MAIQIWLWEAALHMIFRNIFSTENKAFIQGWKCQSHFRCKCSCAYNL